MIDYIKKNQDLLIKIFACVFILGILVHGYRYFNADFSHDSLTAINHFDHDRLMKRSSGRFMGIINVFFRGHISAPWLLGALSLVWLSLSCFFLVKIFNITKQLYIYALCAISVTNMSFIYTHASFVHEIDLFALAFLFSVLSIYVYQIHRYGYLMTIALTCLTCFTYQPYFAISVTLALFLMIHRLIKAISIRDNIIDAAKLCFSLLLGAISFICLFKLAAMLMPGYISTSGYNNPTGVLSNYSTTLFSNFTSTYEEFGYRVLNANTYLPRLVAACYLSLIALSLFLCARRACQKGLQLSSWVLLAGSLLIIPFSLNIVTFIASGLTHQLIQCSTIMLLILPITLLSIENKSIICQRITLICIGIIVWSNTVFAHHVYLNKTLIEKQTASLMTRITHDIESFDNYDIKSTPIYFIGHWEDSPSLKPRHGFEHTKRGFGLGYRTSIEMRANEHITSYYKNYFGSPALVNRVNKFCDLSASLRETIDAMPCFPRKGYCQLINGAIFVKISDLEHAHVLIETKG